MSESAASSKCHSRLESASDVEFTTSLKRALSYVSATSRRDITCPGSISFPGKATRPTYVASPGGADS